LDIRINFEQPLLDFLQTLEKAYPYTTKNKVTIQRIWKCIPVFLCWQIWLTQNKCNFKNQIPRIGKTFSKTWGLTSEILNVKGTTLADHSTLHQEERDWLNKAIINNNGQKGNKKINSGNIWKIRISGEKLTHLRKNQNRYYLYFDGASNHNPGKARVGGIILDLDGKKNVTYEWGLGQILNNKAKAYNLLMGTRIIKKKRNSKSYHKR